MAKCSTMRRSVTCGRSPDDFVIDPDEQVQAVVRLIFEQFAGEAV